jgi:hypothetical protein
MYDCKRITYLVNSNPTTPKKLLMGNGKIHSNSRGSSTCRQRLKNNRMDPINKSTEFDRYPYQFLFLKSHFLIFKINFLKFTFLISFFAFHALEIFLHLGERSEVCEQMETTNLIIKPST